MSDHVCEMCGSAWSGSLPPGKIYLCERCRPEAPDVDPAVFEREKAKLQKALRDMERSTMSDHDDKGRTPVPGVDTESIPLTRTVSVDTYRIAIGEVQRLRDRVAELERKRDMFEVAFERDRVLTAELDELHARHRKLREAMSRLVDEFEGFSLKGHYGKCSPPMTDCDGDCANDAWLQEVLAKARRALAEDKEQEG